MSFVAAVICVAHEVRPVAVVLVKQRLVLPVIRLSRIVSIIAAVAVAAAPAALPRRRRLQEKARQQSCKGPSALAERCALPQGLTPCVAAKQPHSTTQATWRAPARPTAPPARVRGPKLGIAWPLLHPTSQLAAPFGASGVCFFC